MACGGSFVIVSDTAPQGLFGSRPPVQGVEGVGLEMTGSPVSYRLLLLESYETGSPLSQMSLALRSWNLIRGSVASSVLLPGALPASKVSEYRVPASYLPSPLES